MKVYAIVPGEGRLTISSFMELADAHPDGIVTRTPGFGSEMVIADAEYVAAITCGCDRCDNEARDAAFHAGWALTSWISRTMIVCPLCGNKRCPRATWHENDCTGSNDPGQEGSRYA